MDFSSVFNHISYHAVYDASILEALEYARKNGFAGIQVADETPHLSFENLSPKEVESVGAYARNHGLYVNMHAPDEAASLLQYSRHLQSGIMSYYKALFDFASKVGSRIVTLHVGKISTFRTAITPEYLIPPSDEPFYRRTLNESIREIIDLAEDRFCLCMENYQLDPFILDILSPYVERQEIALCWDLAKTEPPTLEYFLKYSNHVRQVHLHDVCVSPQGTRKSHRNIGTGDLDFIYYLTQLASKDVQDYCIEVRPREAAVESLQTLRKLLC